MEKEYHEDDINIKKEFNKFLKRTLQFVLSVSVFSFFLWYSSGFSILPQCFNAYFSTCLFSMLTRTLERKYMFLICNAILALLAMSPHFHIQLQASTKATQVSQEAVGAFPFLVNAPLMVEEEEIEEYSEQGTDTLFVETEGRVVEGKDEEGGTGSSGVMVAHDDDDELVADTTLMELETTEEELENTDELNRKIEEFIRKMKEEMGLRHKNNHLLQSS